MADNTDFQPFSSFGESDNKDEKVSSIRHVGTTKFIVPNKKNKWVLPFIIVVLILLALFGLILFIFNSDGSTADSTTGDNNQQNNEASNKTVINPLTGVMYTEEESKDWAGQRPIAVMINNHIDARPQWGIGEAELVYEIVAEGGITRYLAFYSSSLPEKIGPVRSTREYYLVLVKELGDAAIMHIGWSPQALEAINTWPVRSLTRGGAQFDRDQARLDQGIATEHTAYVDGPYLRDLTNSLGWEGYNEYNLYKFKEDTPQNVNLGENNCDMTLAGHCEPITVDFWYTGDYTAMFKYDPEKNVYLKFTGYDADGNPIPTIDANNDEQVTVKNLIIQFVTESAIENDDKSRLEYQLIGSGEGLVFKDGRATNVTWTKPERDARTMFYDQNGDEIQFNRGNFWISIVPDRNVEQVSY